MADPSYAVTGFLGGEISEFAQGRFDKPDYKLSLNVCYNSFPVEIGAWVRRPGTQFAGWTRAGAPGRIVGFDFQQSSAYTIELTAGYMRFRSGANLVTTNDSVGLSAISAASPAEITLASAVNWATGDEIFFSNMGTSCPTLQNRRFALTKIDTTHFTLTDLKTGANISGSGVGTPAAGTLVNHVNDIVTPYTGMFWESPGLRVVQTETSAFFLHSSFPPYQLNVSALPTGSNFASFNFAQSIFQDGPYLDPVPGTTVTPGATSGITTLTIGFQAYSSTQAYTKGAFVTSSSVGYVSLQDGNVNNTPASSPTWWQIVGFGAAINNGQGFVASDIGRMIRLFSEPPLWSSTTTYGKGSFVMYNPSNLPGYETYWSSQVTDNVGNIPGTDAVNWDLVDIGSTSNPALWTWGKITSLSSTGAISGATGTDIGDMIGGGGLSAAFDGVDSKTESTCARNGGFTEGNFAQGYVGKNYSPSTAISQAVIFPSSDFGFCNNPTGQAFTVALYASNSAPSSYNNGTLLGSTTVPGNSLATITLQSNNTTTTFEYVWIAIYGNIGTATAIAAAQVTFYNASAAPGTAVNVEILGPALIYSATAMPNWRLGLYSNTTGWPNVGTYSDGRLWLSCAAYPNRFDACVADGISGVNNGQLAGYVNFAPTDQYGNVLDSSAIDYTINAPGANAIYNMLPTLQGVILFTQAGECLVTAPTAGGISPTNISARFVTKIGSANVEPRATEHTYVFVQRYSVKLMEYFADIFSGKFSAPNLADKAQHITRNGIAEIAYVHSATPIVWGRDTDGNLFGCTYKRDTLMTSQGPTYYAWHRHGLGSGRTIQSICSGPSIGGNLDALTMVTTDGSTYWVEIMTDTLDELATLAQSWFLDGAVVPASVTFSLSSPSPNGGATLNGLWYLNGKTVEVFCGGLDCGAYTVSNGSVTVPYGDGISAGTGGGLFTNSFAVANQSTFVVGFEYTSQGQLVRPQDPVQIGTRLGPGLGKIRQLVRASALFSNLGLDNTYPVSGNSVVYFGASFGALFPAIINAATTRVPDGIDALPTNQLSTYSSVWRDSIRSEADYDGRVCWQITGPLPCNIAAIEVWCRGEDGP